MEQAPEPCAIVIFGASGDLTRRKLMPALYKLAVTGSLPPHSAGIGFARSEKTPEQFRSEMRAALEETRGKPVKDDIWAQFEKRIDYINAGDHDHAAYERLAKDLKKYDEEYGTKGNRIYYLATPPSAYEEIITLLGEAGLAKQEGEGFKRIIVEKPFGRDSDSAAHLNDVIHQYFDEKQIFRIDHYLGKETVQNLFVFRFSNGIFEPVWNRRYIDHVQITVAESLGVEDRGSYYEEAGVVRDMVANHLLQLVTLTAMEPPVEFTADAIRDEKVKVLHALEHGGIDRVVRGQYEAGAISGDEVPGYQDEKGVARASTTATYVALEVAVDNWRWAGVPFFLRTGKRMPKRVTEIAIVFKQAPFLPFQSTAVQSLEPNVMAVRVQPNEGIGLRFGAKMPGEMRIRNVTMDFDYEEAFGVKGPEAYERLLLDAMRGDATLFTRADEVAMQWAFVEPCLDSDDEPYGYPAGSWGPPEAATLIAPRTWRRL